MKTCVSLFAGIGGKTMGAMAAGYKPVLSVEWNPDPKIGPPDALASVYADNLGDKHLLVQDVRTVDFTPYRGAALLMASPPCIRASVANAKQGETPLDMELAEAVCRAIRQIDPEKVLLENVYPYRKFKAFQAILATLDDCGYRYTVDHVDAADYGVPQNRRRLILRAQKGFVAPPGLRPTHAKDGKGGLLPWVGWYEAIADLIPSLPETELAPWQVKRLTAKYGENWLETLCGDSLVTDQSGSRGEVQVVDGVPPSTTVVSSPRKHHARAVLIDGDNACKAGPIEHDALKPWDTVSGKSGRRRGLLVNGIPQNYAGDIWDCPQAQDAPVVSASADRHPMRSVLVEGTSVGERPPTLRTGGDPAITINGGGGGRAHRAVIVGGANRSQSFLTFAQEHRKDIPGVKEGHEPINGVSATSSSDFRAVLVGSEGFDGEVVVLEDNDLMHGVTANQSQSCTRAVLVTNQGDQPNGHPERLPKMVDGSDPAQPVVADSCSRTRAILCMPNGEDYNPRNAMEPGGSIAAIHGEAQYRAVLVDNGNPNRNGAIDRGSQSPSETVIANAERVPYRAILGYRVVQITVPCLARFQSFPDWFRFPASKKLATTGIGNAVPPLLVQAILEGGYNAA